MKEKNRGADFRGQGQLDTGNGCMGAHAWSALGRWKSRSCQNGGGLRLDDFNLKFVELRFWTPDSNSKFPAVALLCHTRSTLYNRSLQDVSAKHGMRVIET
jgi:hypothetical protein